MNRDLDVAHVLIPLTSCLLCFAVGCLHLDPLHGRHACFPRDSRVLPSFLLSSLVSSLLISFGILSSIHFSTLQLLEAPYIKERRGTFFRWRLISDQVQQPNWGSHTQEAAPGYHEAHPIRVLLSLPPCIYLRLQDTLSRVLSMCCWTGGSTVNAARLTKIPTHKTTRTEKKEKPGQK